MRYIILVLLSVMFLKGATQNITLKTKNLSLEKALQALEKQYNYTFAYSSDKINLNRIIHSNISNASINDALNELFGSTNISWQINHKNITLFVNPNAKLSINGYIKEQGTGELLIGVFVWVDGKIQTTSNGYGFYSLSLQADTHALSFSYLGFKSKSIKVELNENLNLNIDLKSNLELGEVLVNGSTQNTAIKSCNSIDIPLMEINNVPMILGEKDPVKYLMQSAGVQKGTEGNSYMYVRGGGPDQNLILIDDAVIYNAYHFLGLSSLVSGNELRSAELIKGGFSSKFGGRLSSVLNMSLKDGNKERLAGEVSTGLLSSKLLLEGPIIKNKASFVVSGRRSYINQWAKILTNNTNEALGFYYYDLHGKVSLDINAKNKLFSSFYSGLDNFNFSGSGNENINWGNNTFSLRWNHQFSPKLFLNSTLSTSNYRTEIGFGITGNTQDSIASNLVSSITDYALKTDFDYFMSENNVLKFGLGLTNHLVEPHVNVLNKRTQTTEVHGTDYHANDAFSYVEWQNKSNKNLTLTTGIRLSVFNSNTNYFRAEPRINLNYYLKRDYTLNASYSLMNQYLHLISSLNGLGFPCDIWTMSTQSLSPQRAQIGTIGICKGNIGNKQISFVAELYYKYIENISSLKEGASFLQMLPLFSPNIQINNVNDLITQGNCKSYGLELMVKKTGTHFSGNISYTLSRSTMQFDDINRGNEFLSNYDRTHDIGVYLNYKTKKHFTFSFNWIYGTGYPISLPSGEYIASQNTPQGNMPGMSIYDYDHKNNYRMVSYNRLDLSVQYSHTIFKKMNSNFELSLYNTYNRANPFYYQITNKDDASSGSIRVLKQMSLFPIIPSISWSLKF